MVISSHVDGQEEPKGPLFAPQSLPMKRKTKAEKRSLLPTFSLASPPEWQMTSKRVEEVPWIRLKRRRAGRG